MDTPATLTRQTSFLLGLGVLVYLALFGTGLAPTRHHSARHANARHPAESPPPGIVVTETSSAPTPRNPAAAGDPPGDAILHAYGDPSRTPAQDMELLACATGNFLLVSKNLRDRPLATNADWSNALRGRVSGADRWLSEDNPVFDTKGHLCDRWGSPLFFHSLGGRRWEIRSAGPDRELWTADDLLRPTAGGAMPAVNPVPPR